MDTAACVSERNTPQATETCQGAIGDQATGRAETTGTGDSLWDKAYDALSKEKGNPIVDYEALLSRVLVRGEPFEHAHLTPSNLPCYSARESDTVP